MNSTLRNAATLGAGVLLLVVFLAVGALYESDVPQPLCPTPMGTQPNDPLLQVVFDYANSKYGWEDGSFVVERWDPMPDNEYVVTHCSLLLDDEPRMGGSEYEFVVVVDRGLRRVVRELSTQ